MAKRWTQEEKDLLVKLRIQGLTAREMVHHFEGRSEATIRNLVSKLCPKNSKWTEDEDQLIEKLLQEGITATKEIARRLPNRTNTAVQARINHIISEGRANRRNRQHDWSVHKSELLIQMRNEGKSNQEIADALDVPIGLISKKVVDLIKTGKIESRLIQMDWSDDEDALLCDLRSQGVSTEQIAKQLGRSHGSVANHISRLIQAGALDPYHNVNRDFPCQLYLVYFVEEGFYKIGITQNNVNTRFNGYPTYKIIETLTFKDLEEAKKVENRLMEMVKPFQYTPLVFKYGSTECFQIPKLFNSIIDLTAYIEAYENNS